MHRPTALLLFLIALVGWVPSARADEALADPAVLPPARTTLVDAGPNRLLLATGAASFAFSFGGALWVGATSTRTADRALLVPFAGPWIALRSHAVAACGETTMPCGQETTYAALMVADGLVQAASAVQIALAFLHRDLQETRDPVVRSARISVAPARPPGGGLGLSAIGEF